MSPQKFSLSEWLERIASAHPQEIELGLERVGSVAKQLSCLEFSCPVVTVAGTNGKGSVVALLTQLALSKGMKVGSYTSPHFVRFNERIQLDGEPASDELIVNAFEAIDAALKGAITNSDENKFTLSYFEYATLAALEIFKLQAPDFIILEVGLGGRLDAVNVIDADIAVITSIGIDHEDWLGKGRDRIGVEKAGVARQGRPVIIGEVNPPALMMDALEKLGTLTYLINRDFWFEAIGEGARFCLNAGLDVDVEPSGKVIGSALEQPVTEYYQITFRPHLAMENVSVALQVMACFGINFNEQELSKALKRSRLSGRCEILKKSNGPLLVFDVAHNPAASKMFYRELNERIGLNPRGRKAKKIKIRAMIGIMEDKDLSGVVEPFENVVDEWYPCSIEMDRALAPKKLNQALKDKGLITRDLKKRSEYIFSQLVSESSIDDVLIVMGSFYLIGPIIRSSIPGSEI